jgi:hypothetical protein
MVTRLRAGIRPIVVLFSAETTEFGHPQNIRTGLDDQKTSYSNGTQDSIPGCNKESV